MDPEMCYSCPHKIEERKLKAENERLQKEKDEPFEIHCADCGHDILVTPSEWREAELKKAPSQEKADTPKELLATLTILEPDPEFADHMDKVMAENRPKKPTETRGACKICGKSEENSKHERYGPDEDNPVKHRYEPKPTEKPEGDECPECGKSLELASFGVGDPEMLSCSNSECSKCGWPIKEPKSTGKKNKE